MKIFETLYKRTKTGAIQYWKISVGLSTYPTIYKESGQLGTDNPVQHKEEIREGKQKRSTAEQAVFQAESDWKKKHDEGYKSLEDLGIGHQNGGVHHGLFTIYGAVQVPAKSLEEVLQATLPQFNTDANGNVKPMLAKAVDWSKVKYPCLVQPKLDGVRCLMVVKDGEVTFLSRSGKPYTTLTDIECDVENFIEENNHKDFILDGEIYSHELTFQEIVAAVKKQRPESSKLMFRAYDIVSNESQEDRWDTILRLVNSLQSDYITTVECINAKDKTDVLNAHAHWVLQGYEGAMIRHLDGIYGQGQRSSDLLKVKEFDDSEFKFITFEKGQRDEDLIAVCSHGVQEFRAKMIGDREQKQEMWNNGHILSGKQITIKHFGWTDDQLPRFPIGKAFRED